LKKKYEQSGKNKSEGKRRNKLLLLWIEKFLPSSAFSALFILMQIEKIIRIITLIMSYYHYLKAL
jgi:hypothetical protein